MIEQLTQGMRKDQEWMIHRIEQIKAAPDGAKRWLKDLSKNDFEHAQAVEEYAGKTLQESHVALKPEELYLLLHAIYTHDVGYRSGAKNHARASHNAIIGHPKDFFIHDNGLAQAVALIVLAHGLEGLSEIPNRFPVDFLSKTEEFDLRFLGALLLVADEMDQGFLRVFNRLGQSGSVRNDVYHVDIGPQIVNLKTKPSSKDQWKRLSELASRVEERLKSVSDILRARGVRIEQARLYPTVWSDQEHLGNARKTQIGSLSRRPTENDLLFLLDRTVLGAEVIQYGHLDAYNIDAVPISAAHMGGCSLPTRKRYQGIIWMLGEDYAKPILNDLLDLILANTWNGGGLVLFPFVAWSVSQGINDAVQDALPVTFVGRLQEAEKQEISSFHKHLITRGSEAFSLENTYEWLQPKPNAIPIVLDSEGRPFITIGKYGKGRTAYINVCSHVCAPVRPMVSPWQQSPILRKLVTRTIAWALGEH